VKGYKKNGNTDNSDLLTHKKIVLDNPSTLFYKVSLTLKSSYGKRDRLTKTIDSNGYHKFSEHAKAYFDLNEKDVLKTAKLPELVKNNLE
jgi:hypothetical protein